MQLALRNEISYVADVRQRFAALRMRARTLAQGPTDILETVHSGAKLDIKMASKPKNLLGQFSRGRGKSCTDAVIWSAAANRSAVSGRNGASSFAMHASAA